jgi:DNA polymerase III, alpha subunit
LFAKNLNGYKNLIKLSSKSFLDIKSDDDPHCQISDLEKFNQGLVLLSGCFDGFIGKLFFKNLTSEIEDFFKKFKEIFKDDFYIEIQRHNDIGEKLFEKFLLNTSEKLKLPLIATHEVFYLDKDMHEAHDAYLCIGEKTYVNLKDRRKYTDEHYLKTSDEMYKLFNDLPEALKNNANFPFRVSYRPKNSYPILPNIQTNETKDVDQLLTKNSEDGLIEKLNEYVIPLINENNKQSTINLYQERLKHEIGIISKMKYSSYFLIVSDYIKWAKIMIYQ